MNNIKYDGLTILETGFSVPFEEFLKNNLDKNVTLLIKAMETPFASPYMKAFKEAIDDFRVAYLEALENPNSVVNFYDYLRKLDAFHWAYPYKIEPSELKLLIEQAVDEKSFDKMLNSFFSKERVNCLFDEIYSILPSKHKVIFKQIRYAFDMKLYALINNSILSIIDDMLGIVLEDKGCIKRYGILNPVISFFENYSVKDVGFLFQLQMLANNLDFIYTKYRFNEKITIETNKTVRRHLSAHGKMYSNNRIDSIMLLNTIISIHNNMEYLLLFKDTLNYINKTKSFVISKKNYVIRNRVQKKLGI